MRDIHFTIRQVLISTSPRQGRADAQALIQRAVNCDRCNSPPVQHYNNLHRGRDAEISYPTLRATCCTLRQPCVSILVIRYLVLIFPILIPWTMGEPASEVWSDYSTIQQYSISQPSRPTLVRGAA